MRRRDLVAGIGSLGVLAGAGAALRGALPSLTDASDADDATEDDDSDGPAEIETIDASGSEAGTVLVPGDRPTVLTFFVTTCGYCQSQVAPFSEAREVVDETYGPDAARFLAVNYMNADKEPPDAVQEWWNEHGGNAMVGYQSGAGLASQYGVITYPVTVVVDADGERRWKSDVGVQSASDIIAELEPVLEDAEAIGESEDDEPSGADDESDDSTEPDGSNEADGDGENAENSDDSESADDENGE